MISTCYRRVMLNKATVLGSHVQDCHPHTSTITAPTEVLWSHNLEAKQQKLINKLLRSFNRPMEKATRYMSAKYCSHLHNKLETRIWNERQLQGVDSNHFRKCVDFFVCLASQRDVHICALRLAAFRMCEAMPTDYNRLSCFRSHYSSRCHFHTGMKFFRFCCKWGWWSQTELKPCRLWESSLEK